MDTAEPQPTRPNRARRIVAHPLTLLAIGFVWFALCYALAGVAASRLLPSRNAPLQALVAIGFAAFAVVSYKGYAAWIERRPDREFALPGAAAQAALGLLAGFALFCAAAGIVALLGGLEVMAVRGTGQLWAMLAMAIISGVYEEVLFRGVVFRQLEALWGSWVALALTSAFFGAAHLSNPDATWFAAFAIAVEAGILLGAAFMLTRRLWLPIGLHIGWNFTQGWVFSVPVSGGRAPIGLLATRRLGPDWLTGGDFGLEASVVALVVATLAGLAMLIAARRRGQVLAPRGPRQTKL